MEIVFKLLNLSVIPAWLLLAFLPKHKITHKIIYNYAYHIILALAYLGFIAYGMFINVGEGGMGSLDDLRLAFENDFVLTAAWLHYLCFDLFVGTWITKQAIKKGINQWFLLPVLFFTLMFGPVGLLFYFGLDFMLKKQL